METNEFRITQWGDEDFTIARKWIIPLDTFANMFRKVKKTEIKWYDIKDHTKPGKYYTPPRHWKDIDEAKAFIDKKLADEAKYPIQTRHP